MSDVMPINEEALVDSLLKPPGTPTEREVVLGIAIAAAVGGVHFLTQAIHHFTGRP